MFTQTRNAIPTSVADAEAPQAEGAAPVAPVALNESQPGAEKPRVLEEVVIEEVSIDGMCGVY